MCFLYARTYSNLDNVKAAEKKIGNRLPVIAIAVPYSELRVEWQPNKVNPALELGLDLIQNF
jgi:hypothetical protein